MRRLLNYGLLLLTLAFSGCYSFTGISVGDAKTVSVSFFENYADLISPTLSQTFTETLRDIFVQQTPLNLIASDADLEFEGSIVEYSIKPINAQANQQATVAQNRLTIEVNVIFTNNLDPDKSFEKKFSRYDDYSAENDISQVEQELHEKLSQELAENILNQATGDW